tara:strand:- start:10466 stop:11410 length:945 start_codon:yes stop_codon:yes gene_type:complete
MKFKKPKFWDLKKPNLISYLLFPLTLIMIINNYFLRFKSKKKNKKIKSICVGNIYLGGTGKTPTTIAIYDILKRLKFKVSTAKKFYKSFYDENLILKKKTKFISSSDRNNILLEGIAQDQQILIFDDGLQDKNISYDIEFVCFDSSSFVGNGCLIPSGPLRENLNSLKKYDAIFIKTENEIIQEQLDLIKKYNKNIKIFETFFKITNLNEFNLNDEFIIFSGIGNPNNFKKILINNKFKINKEIIFADHYNYKKDEIEKILTIAKKENCKIITTEKDFVKIEKFGFTDINFIDVILKVKNEKKFIEFLKNKIYE